MDFGRILDFDKKDFQLSKWQDFRKYFGKTPFARLNLGLPVWANKDLVGKVYPEGVRSNEYLYYYAKNFNSIELNSTYYSIPSRDRLLSWRDQVNHEFKFCLKCPKTISHSPLFENNKYELSKLFEALALLEENRGVCFIGLPPNFGPDLLYRLKNLVIQLPKEFDFAIEFRHPGWFESDLTWEITAQFLASKNITAVITDTPGRPDVAHMGLVTNKTFVRFVGNSLHETDFKRLDLWSERISQFIDMGASEINFFMHQPNEAHGVELSEYFLKKFDHLNLDQMTPKRVIPQEQLSLF